MSSSLTMVGRI